MHYSYPMWHSSDSIFLGPLLTPQEKSITPWFVSDISTHHQKAHGDDISTCACLCLPTKGASCLCPSYSSSQLERDREGDTIRETKMTKAFTCLQITVLESLFLRKKSIHPVLAGSILPATTTQLGPCSERFSTRGSCSKTYTWKNEQDRWRLVKGSAGGSLQWPTRWDLLLIR
jgi:hypothetical protein